MRRSDVSVNNFYDWCNHIRQERPVANPGAQSKVSDETIIAGIKKLREDMTFPPPRYHQVHAMLRDLNIKVDSQAPSATPIPRGGVSDITYLGFLTFMDISTC